jgi:hypothetical protein
MEKKVADLRSHEDCQARLGLAEEAVKSYERAYKAGKSLPALECFEVDGELIVVDGFHRLEAAKRADVATLPVEIVGKGTMAEAEWTALGKNHNHGVRRTREDKRKAVQMALGNEAAAKMSNRKLAEYLEVSHTFVANERKMWDLCGNVAVPEVRWANQLIADIGIEPWRRVCERDVECFEKENPWTTEHYDGHLTYGAKYQWERMSYAFNELRFQIELREGGPSWIYYWLNLTHVACIVARACGYDPEPGMWRNIGKGFSVDFDLPVDDIRRYGHMEEERCRLWTDADLADYNMRAPHRHVVLSSDVRNDCGGDEDWQEEWANLYAGRTWPPKVYSIERRGDLHRVAVDGSHVEPGHETEASAREWIEEHAAARGHGHNLEIQVQP